MQKAAIAISRLKPELISNPVKGDKFMTEYEQMMLKLKMLEIGQRQVLVAIAATPDLTDVVGELNTLVENAADDVDKLLKEDK